MGKKCNPWLCLAGVEFHMVLPAALLGAAIGLREWRRLSLLYMFAVLYAASVIAFFVVSRLRLPAVPALILFAGLAAGWWALRQARWAKCLLAAAIVLGTALWLRPESEPNRDADYQMAAAAYFSRAQELEGARRLSEARRLYGRAVAFNPDHSGALEGARRVSALLLPIAEPGRPATDLCERGRQAAESNRYHEALELLENARRLEPGSSPSTICPTSIS